MSTRKRLARGSDGGLDAVQMASVELHVSTCARCQAIVGAAARSAPVIAPVVNEGWLRFPRWALAPIAAAAAITIWMVVPQDTMQAPPGSGAGGRTAKAGCASAGCPQAGSGAAGAGFRGAVALERPSLPQCTARAPRPEAFTEAKGQRANAGPPAVQDRDQRKPGTYGGARRRGGIGSRPPHRVPRPRCRRASHSPSRRSRSCQPTHPGDGAS